MRIGPVFTENDDNIESQEEPKWQALEAKDRRVLGVLIEKAKTTPSNYPLTMNAIRTASNQKSNRFPQMQLEEEDVEDALERLRLMGAVSVIQGGHRTDKCRHLAYDWLGVDKKELAVMAELLLRGAQTLGELRSRASRMERIAGQAELRPIIARLDEKELIVYVTPPGRGAIITHNLYTPREMEKVLREHGSGTPEPISSLSKSSSAPTQASIQQPADSTGSVSAAPDSGAPVTNKPTTSQGANTLSDLEQRVVALEDAMAAIQAKLENL